MDDLLAVVRLAWNQTNVTDAETGYALGQHSLRLVHPFMRCHPSSVGNMAPPSPGLSVENLAPQQCGRPNLGPLFYEIRGVSCRAAVWDTSDGRFRSKVPGHPGGLPAGLEPSTRSLRGVDNRIRCRIAWKEHDGWRTDAQGDRHPIDLERLVSRFRELLEEDLGENLVSLVLFGSVARGDYRQDSDIDLLVVCESLPSNRWQWWDPVLAVEERLRSSFMALPLKP